MYAWRWISISSRLERGDLAARGRTFGDAHRVRAGRRLARLADLAGEQDDDPGGDERPEQDGDPAAGEAGDRQVRRGFRPRDPPRRRRGDETARAASDRDGSGTSASGAVGMARRGVGGPLSPRVAALDSAVNSRAAPIHDAVRSDPSHAA